MTESLNTECIHVVMEDMQSNQFLNAAVTENTEYGFDREKLTESGFSAGFGEKDGQSDREK